MTNFQYYYDNYDYVRQNQEWACQSCYPLATTESAAHGLIPGAASQTYNVVCNTLLA